VNTKLNYGGVSAFIGGFEIGPDSASPAAPHTLADGPALKILAGPSEYFE
jgi:hypothetical protein